MTKIIYINWDTHEIVTNAKEKEQWVDGWIGENVLLYSFEEWLEAYHEVSEIYYMSAEEKTKLPIHYAKYLKDEREVYARKAEKVFSVEFDEIGVEVGGYAD